ncbi:MAG: Stk1 family PASTA domain-containing Ser/Thr kinase [Marmoricola sp.]
MTETPDMNGRYDVGELLGRGGMAEVRKATDTRLGRTVAIKRLRTDLAGDPTFQARFRREAQSAASLNHPAIVSVYDTGEEITTGADGMSVAQPYIVMEYVAGRTLREVLNDGRKLLPERAMEITSGVLSALDYSHRMGIIHRDIKPANVMLTPNGEVKVMDFGIARAVADVQNTMTQTSAVVGTAQYLSPEQARGENVDARSDIYSTGCLLYELLTGRPPFVGDSPVAVAYQHVREQAPRPSSVEPNIPAAIDAIVMKALSKNVDERYQTAAAMKADIDRYLAGQPIHAQAPATTIVPAVPPTMVDTPTQAGMVPYEEPRRSRGPIIALIIALIVIIAAAILIIPQLLKSHPSQVQVPNVVNMTEKAAKAKLLSSKLTVGSVSSVASNDVPAGSVVSTDPTANTWVNQQSAVNLKVSSGKQKVTIPSNLVGGTLQEATSQLQGLGLTVKSKPVNSKQAQDTVLKITPPGGSVVVVGSTVTVEYASGNQKIPPYTTGENYQQYQQKLNSLGFSVNANPTDSKLPSGSVVSVSPGVGQEVPVGQTITLQYASGNNQVPDVSSNCQTVAQAKAALKAAGFGESDSPDPTNPNTNNCPAGTVLTQDQTAGSTAPVGTVVNLTTVPPSGNGNGH